MADAEGERSVAKGGRSAVARGRAVLLGPPKFLNQSPRKRGLSAARAKPGSEGSPGCRARLGPVSSRAGYLRVARSSPVPHRHAILAVMPSVRLDFYIEALFQKMRPLALGLRARTQPRVVNVAGIKRGVTLACFRLNQVLGPTHGSGPSLRGEWMAKDPAIRSLTTVSLEEALPYLDAADGDELTAAYSLARDRNRLDGSTTPPDDTEIHHALFLLRRARGLDAPSFDLMRVQLRRRHAA